MSNFFVVNVKNENNSDLLPENELSCKVCNETFLSQLDLNIHSLEHDAHEIVETKITDDISVDTDPEEISSTNVISMKIPEKSNNSPLFFGATEEAFIWTNENTSVLLEMYKKYYRQVGKGSIKTQKAMFLLISKTLNEQQSLKTSPQNCENRIRVLDRNYKKIVTEPNEIKRRRMQRGFEFFKQMEEIQRVRAKLYTITKLSTSIPVSSINNVLHDATSAGSKNVANNAETGKSKSKWEMKLKALFQLREMKKNYYAKKLVIENAKLEEMKRRNKLTHERNKILREKLQMLNLKLREIK